MAAARVRLVTAGPAHGTPVGVVGASPNQTMLPPHKLFELVPGAVVVGQVAPDAVAIAEITLKTPGGRMRHRIVERADEDGQLRLRVPYPTPTDRPHDAPPAVAARTPWRVKVGEERFEVHVTEADVRGGQEVALRSPNSSP